MLITKFNRMIRNRVLWAVFAFIVSLSFVVTYSAGGCTRDPSGGRAVGRLYGKDVNPEEFNSARFYELGLRRNASMPPEAEEGFRQRVWARLAALKTAEAMGLVATDAEVASTLHRDRSFAVNGTFNADRYRSLVRQQVGVTVPMFESYLRQELTIEKLRDLASGFAWASPLEVRDRVTDLADRRRLEYVVLNREALVPSVEVSRDHAVQYYQANTNRFEIPERVQVAYVRFDPSNYLEKVSMTDTNVSEYYKEHIELYSVTSTNGETTAKPLADVRADVESRLRRDLAREKAIEQAGEFAIRLVPGRRTAAVPFDTAASEAGFTVRTTALFSALENPIGTDPATFASTAFELDLSDPSMRCSDVVAGSNTVVVMTLLDRKAACVPAFDEVAAKVMPMAVSNATDKAFGEKAAAIRQSVADALAAGKSFRDAVSAFALNVSTTAPFAVYGGLPEGTPHGDALAGAVVSLDQGELSEVVPSAQDKILAYVVERLPADAATVELLSSQMQNTLARYRGGMVFRSWAEAMLGEAGFTNLMASVEQEPVDEEGGGPNDGLPPTFPVDL